MFSRIGTLLGLAALLAAGPLAAGCAQKVVKAQARVEPAPTPLEVPQPPARVIVPPQPEAPAPIEDTQPPNPARSHPVRPAGRQEAKPDAARTDTAAPEAAPPATPETPQPATDIKPVHADAASVAAVRQQMGRASQNLTQVNYAGLSNDMKAQFDTANRFLALANQALKEGNLLFASTLADKAGAIASLLTGR
jgi:outer membrane biosynthesis protein TonB